VKVVCVDGDVDKSYVGKTGYIMFDEGPGKDKPFRVQFEDRTELKLAEGQVRSCNTSIAASNAIDVPDYPDSDEELIAPSKTPPPKQRRTHVSMSGQKILKPLRADLLPVLAKDV